MPDYVVFGNPVAHSRSPAIHQAFAGQQGLAIDYRRQCVPLDGFAAAADAFFAAGGQGANVTLPFKTEAHAWVSRLSERADAAGAVNTLYRAADGVVVGDNTDGIGLVRDITQLQGVALSGKRVMLLGAGGAARGAVLPLLAAGAAAVLVVNRTVAKAEQLAARFGVSAAGFDTAAAWPAEVVINATSGSLSGALMPLPDAVWARAELVYDMMYAAELTPFLRQAQAAGAARVADGLGMLVAQAAEAYALWRGFVPDIAPVVAAIRAEMEATCAG